MVLRCVGRTIRRIPLAVAQAGFTSVVALVSIAPTAFAQNVVCNVSGVGGPASALNGAVNSEAFACGPDAVANGVATVAVGESAQATAQFATAVGASAQARGLYVTSVGAYAGNGFGTGSGNTRLGYFAGAVSGGEYNTVSGYQAGYFATGSQNTAYGYNSGTTVSGSRNVAMGTFSGQTVSGSDNVALGYNAGSSHSASNTVAIGNTARATASGAMAIGQTATAAFSNSVAFGNSVSTSRADQFSFGTNTNTYTFAGIPTAASTAAQTGTIGVVTSDNAGNLARTAIVNDLVTGGATNVLSAQQGVAINGRLTTAEGNITTL